MMLVEKVNNAEEQYYIYESTYLDSEIIRFTYARITVDGITCRRENEFQESSSYGRMMIQLLEDGVSHEHSMDSDSEYVTWNYPHSDAYICRFSEFDRPPPRFI